MVRKRNFNNRKHFNNSGVKLLIRGKKSVSKKKKKKKLRVREIDLYRSHLPFKNVIPNKNEADAILLYLTVLYC